MASSSKLSIVFPILFLLLSSSSPRSLGVASKDPSVSSYRNLLAFQKNSSKNRIPNCGEMASRSQCLQSPKCRWCHSDALDDMCFSKVEAWRLPQQDSFFHKQPCVNLSNWC